MSPGLSTVSGDFPFPIQASPAASPFETLTVIEERMSESGDDLSSRSFCYSFFWSKKKNRTRNIFIILCVAYVLHNIVTTTQTFFKFDTGVAVSNEKLQVLNKSLPGVTICNKNLISKEKALLPHKVPGFEDMIKAFHDGSMKLEDFEKPAAEPTESTEPAEPKPEMSGNQTEEKSGALKASPTDLMTDQQEDDLTEQQEDPRTRDPNWRRKRKIEIGIYEDFMSAYYTHLPVFQQIEDGPEPHKFLTYMTCNQKDWPELDSSGKIVPSTFNCADKKSIHTAQGKGNCITLFHDASSTTGSSSRDNDNVKFQSLGNDWEKNTKLTPIKVGKEKDFVPLELIKLVLDFGPDNYTDLRKDVGGEIMFHDTRSIPLEASLSYTLMPGKAYMFLLKKSTTRSLPAPYNTNCTDYYGTNWINYQRGKAMLTDVNSLPLSRTHCIEQCILRKVIPQTGCWPKQIPFVASTAGLEQNHLVNVSGQTLKERGNLNWCHRQKICTYERKATVEVAFLQKLQESFLGNHLTIDFLL